MGAPYSDLLAIHAVGRVNVEGPSRPSLASCCVRVRVLTSCVSRRIEEALRPWVSVSEFAIAATRLAAVIDLC